MSLEMLSKKLKTSNLLTANMLPTVKLAAIKIKLKWCLQGAGSKVIEELLTEVKLVNINKIIVGTIVKWGNNKAIIIRL